MNRDLIAGSSLQGQLETPYYVVSCFLTVSRGRDWFRTPTAQGRPRFEM